MREIRKTGVLRGPIRKVLLSRTSSKSSEEGGNELDRDELLT
jgi:hypothetical protein